MEAKDERRKSRVLCVFLITVQVLRDLVNCKQYRYCLLYELAREVSGSYRFVCTICTVPTKAMIGNMDLLRISVVGGKRHAPIERLIQSRAHDSYLAEFVRYRY